MGRLSSPSLGSHGLHDHTFSAWRTCCRPTACSRRLRRTCQSPAGMAKVVESALLVRNSHVMAIVLTERVALHDPNAGNFSLSPRTAVRESVQACIQCFTLLKDSWHAVTASRVALLARRSMACPKLNKCLNHANRGHDPD